MLRDLIKVAQKLDSLGLTRDANELDSLIRKIAGSLEESKAEFYAAQKEQRELAEARRMVAAPSRPQLSVAEQIALNDRKWKEQQEAEAEDPEVKIIEEAATVAQRFTRTKRRLFQAKRQSPQDKHDIMRIESNLMEHEAALDDILSRAREIDSKKTGSAKFERACWRDVSRVIYEIKTAPIEHRPQHTDYKAPEMKERRPAVFNKERRVTTDTAEPSPLPRLTTKKASR